MQPSSDACQLPSRAVSSGSRGDTKSPTRGIPYSGIVVGGMLVLFDAFCDFNQSIQTGVSLSVLSEVSWSYSPQEHEICLCSKSSRSALGPIQPAINYYWELCPREGVGV